jgi:tetratricopeptide (TPR) repeat protein
LTVEASVRCIVWTAILTGLAPVLSAAENTKSPDVLVRQGDVFDRKIQPAEALPLYLEAEKQDDKNVGLLLRIARQYRHLAAAAPTNAEKIALFETSKTYANRAVALEPRNAETHLSLAISYAKMLPLLERREQIDASKSVKINVDEALALNPRLDLAWHVLGCWNHRLAEIGPVKRAAARMLYGEIPDGSNAEAVACLEKAITLNPDRLSHYIELGLVRAAEGQPEAARALLEKGLAMPNVDHGDPDCKARGEAALAKLPAPTPAP